MNPRGEITLLISEWQRGDKGAESALFEMLYQRLHGIAVQCLRNEAPGQTLSPTALVHEAYLRFAKSEVMEVSDRRHFLALAAQVMRRILVDRARARRAGKRGGGTAAGEFDESLVRTDSAADEILAVDLALEELERQSPRQAHLVELRYFAGYDYEEAAAVLGISSRQVRRDWQVARTRLRIAIDGTKSPN